MSASIGEIRFKGERLLVRGDGAVQVPLPHQRQAHVVVGRGTVRVELDRLLERGDGAVRIPHFTEDDAQVVVEAGIVRVDQNGIAVVCRGFLEPPL